MGRRTFSIEAYDTVSQNAITRYVYIGANLIKHGLKKYRVFIGKPDGIIDELKTKYSLIAQLFVAVDKLDEARKKITEKGTVLYLANEQILKGGNE